MAARAGRYRDSAEFFFNHVCYLDFLNFLVEFLLFGNYVLLKYLLFQRENHCEIVEHCLNLEFFW